MPSDERPNILFLCVDALRVFECLADDGPVMNAYDRLADTGVEFTQMISTSTTTSPCMASIHSGEYPFVHGVETLKGPKIRDDITLFIEYLGQQSQKVKSIYEEILMR